LFQLYNFDYKLQEQLYCKSCNNKIQDNHTITIPLTAIFVFCFSGLLSFSFNVKRTVALCHPSSEKREYDAENRSSDQVKEE